MGKINLVVVSLKGQYCSACGQGLVMEKYKASKLVLKKFETRKDYVCPNCRLLFSPDSNGKVGLKNKPEESKSCSSCTLNCNSSGKGGLLIPNMKDVNPC